MYVLYVYFIFRIFNWLKFELTMPRTNNRKRNNRNVDTRRASTASDLSPNAPEFIPIGKCKIYNIYVLGCQT